MVQLRVYPLPAAAGGALRYSLYQNTDALLTRMIYWDTNVSQVNVNGQWRNLPYVRDVLQLDISGGTLEFNGYWYSLQRCEVTLPIQMFIYMRKYEQENGSNELLEYRTIPNLRQAVSPPGIVR
jgi:hypothetical protein